ncbi:MAG: type II secretion system F family protein [Rhodoferax sp.]|nr:type II secretion system F family protein [Rhodoferax sp.]
MSRAFRVRYLVPGGAAVIEEVWRAASADEARERAAQGGGVVLGVRPVAAQGWKLPAPRRATFDAAAWCREFETLLRAGMSPVEALETLAAASASMSEGDARQSVHHRLLARLHEGAALSQAMRETGAFSEVLVAGVLASERTSGLADALAEYLRYDDLLQRLRRQMVSAALYPALVIGLGALIAGFLLLYVIPRFSLMYSGFAGTLSPATEFVLALSRMLRMHGWALVPAAVGLVALVLAAWRGGVVQARAAAWLERASLLRRPVEDFRLANFFQAMSLLVRGGYTIEETLRMAAAVALGPHLGARVARAREMVAAGKTVSESLAAAGLADVMAQRLLAAGERGGSFALVVQTLATRHANAFVTFVERATRLVEPLLMLAVALVIGSLVVMMYMPIFDIAGSVGGPR